MSGSLRFPLGVAIVCSALGLASANAADSPTPDYAVIQLQVEVNRSAEHVWKRVGDYCAISEWLKVTCSYASGSGDVGTVRVINNTTLEPMVAKTAWSYTYGQTAGTLANASYHGTLAVEPEGADKSVLKYTLLYNQAALAPDVDKKAQRDRLAARFQGALDEMKKEAEAPQ